MDEKDTYQASMREVWDIAYPLAFSMLSYTAMQFVNRMMIAWHSPEELAACLPASGLSFTFICLFVGMCAYTNAFVSRFHGAKRKSKITLYLWQGFYLGIISSVVIAACIPLGILIINHSGHSDVVKSFERQYFVIVTLFGGLAPINNALAAFFTGRGKTKITMLVNFIGNAVNVLICYLLIFGVGIFPDMGIKGAAIGFVLGNAIMTVLYLFFILSPSNKKEFRTDKLFSFDLPKIKQLVKYGTPNGVGMLMDISSFTIFFFLSGLLGVAVMSASNIIVSLEMLAFMPILGIGLAGLTLVGKYIGAGKPDKAYKVFNNSLKISLGYSVPLGILFFSFPDFFIGLFAHGETANSPEIYNTAVKLMRILPFFIIADGLQIVAGETVRGSGETKFHMKTAIAVTWLLFIPGIYLILHLPHPSIYLMWIWGTAFLSTLAAIFIYRFKLGKWVSVNINH